MSAATKKWSIPRAVVVKGIDHVSMRRASCGWPAQCDKVISNSVGTGDREVRDQRRAFRKALNKRELRAGKKGDKVGPMKNCLFRVTAQVDVSIHKA